MFLTKLFALFWLIPFVVSGSCPQDQKQISVRVTAEFSLHSYIKTVDHETTITASRNFATSFKKYSLSIESGNSTSSFGDAVQGVIQSVSLSLRNIEQDQTDKLDTITTGEIGREGQTGEKLFHTESSKERDTNPDFLQLVRVITYNVKVGCDMAKLQDTTFVGSVSASSAGNYEERGKYGATYIEKKFQNETGGNIVDNTFTVSTCYNESSQQEINELNQLKVQIQSLKKQFYKRLTDLTDKFRDQGMDIKIEVTEQTYKFQEELIELIQQNNSSIKMQLSDLKQQNNRTNMQLSVLKQQNNRSNMHLSDLTDNVYQQNTSLKQLNTTLKQMNTRQLNSLKIVKAHGGLMADKCKFTCVGTTGRYSTSWSGPGGYMHTTVNMTSCGFVDVPVVTTSLEGSELNSAMSGTAAPRLVTTVQFQIYIKGWVHTSYYKQAGKPTEFTAKSYNWNVNWAAYGYKEC